MIHDIEPKHLYNEWKPNAVQKRSSAVVQFCGRNLLCRIDDNGLKLPSRAMFPDGDERFTYLFELDGREYYLLRDETPREPDGWTYRDINIFRTEQPKEIAFAAVSAWHLCCWYRDTRFCGRCGTPLEHDVNERMMHCPKCGNMIFPRINPSVIVAVTHGDYLLLTQYANRRLRRPSAQAPATRRAWHLLHAAQNAQVARGRDPAQRRRRPCERRRPHRRYRDRRSLRARAARNGRRAARHSPCHRLRG